MFRNPKLLEKTTFVKFDLNTPLTFPLNTQKQIKTGYKFAINDRNRWLDLYNAYFRVNYTLEATNNGNALPADTTSSTLNGSASLINKLEVKSAGKYLYTIDDVHKAVFIKILLDFSADYGRSTAKSQFWCLDTAKDTTLNNNAGIKARELLTQSTDQNNIPKTVETIIPLNRYSFFEELEDKILPPMQLEFSITLQDDTELIWQNDGTDRRVVVITFELWAPSLQFTSEGQRLVNESFLKPAKWKHLRETVFSSTSRRDASGSWQITPRLKNAKHVFVYIQQTRKSKAHQFNPYIFDTFNIDGGDSAKLLTCRLQSGSSEFYPELDYTSEF